MRKLRFSFVNGADVQLTVHEVLHFFRQPSTVGAFAVAAVSLFVFQPFPDLAVLPLAEEVVFWGITFPGAFLIYLVSCILMAQRFGRAYTAIGHLFSAIIVALLSPNLAVALGMDPAVTTWSDRLLVGSFSLIWGVAMEFLIATYLVPPYVRGLKPAGPVSNDPGPGIAAFADTGPFATDQAVVLLGRRFRLPDLLLVTAEEQYVHIHTAQGRQMLRGRMSDVEAQLPDSWGLRIHRSHWVAARSVRALHRARDGWTLELTDGQQLPVARARRDAVADWVARIEAR